MTKTALPQTQPPIGGIPLDGIAPNVLLVEWIVKQQQLLKQQQHVIEEQQREISALQKEKEELKDSLEKLKNRSSQNSSVPPSGDQVKKPSDKNKRKKGKKRGPKYNHQGKTRNGFGEADNIEQLEIDSCPVCGADVESVEDAPKKVQQVAELVEQPVVIQEYHRPLYQCPVCGWSGYSSLPWGVKEGFSYGGRLCSVVGWIGYGGNLTWRAPRVFCRTRIGCPNLSGESGQDAVTV